MKRLSSLVLLLVLGSVLVSCGMDKTAATTAIQSAETAWSAAKDNVMKVLPDDAKSIEDAIAGAKASLEKGDAKAALAAAKDLPAKIQALSASVAAKETELRGTWDKLSAELPAALASAQKQVDVLSKAKKLPAGMDAAALDGAKSSVAEATKTWADAQSALQSGMIADAVTKASGVKDLLVKTLTALKMPVPAALQS